MKYIIEKYIIEKYIIEKYIIEKYYKFLRKSKFNYKSQMRNIYKILKIYIIKMNTMIINAVGFVMILFVLYLVFKKLKSLLPSFLCSTLNKQPAYVQPEHMDDVDIESDNDDSINDTSNIIELDEEDIDVDDINSDDELVLEKADNEDDVELSKEEESIPEKVVETPVKKKTVSKNLKNRKKGTTIKI